MIDVAPQGDAETAGIVASLDGFEGTCVVGWAYSETSANTCVISITDESGRVIVEGEASRERPDLAALGIGRSDFAFHVHVPQLGTTPVVRVFADGVELHGSPAPVGQGHFDGHLYVHDGFATGWVTERLADFSAPLIDIVGPGGEIIASAPSRREESDETGFSPARFRIPLLSLFGATDLEIGALAEGVLFARATCNLRLVGHLDYADPEHCAGWIFSPNAPSAQFAVEIRRDGVLVATAPCDLARNDVRAVHPGSNAFGFDAVLPRRAASPEEPCEISLRLPGSGRELFGGPFIVGQRAGIIAAARRIAQAAHHGTATFSTAERSFLQRALADYVASVRQGRGAYITRRFAHQPQATARRLTVIIPVYRGLKITQACVRSVLAHRNAETDSVLIINDGSPEQGMAPMLATFAKEPNLQLLSNEKNVGFVKTVNRALNAVSDGDVVLLNSDTEVFVGAFDELHRAAHAAPEIGTVTPLSNNATIFSYPHASLRLSELSDMTWRQLSQIARQRNTDAIVDVPTAHGFCMMIKREVLERIGLFDESFGRGYGEENDFCAKAADLGFRNVAAGNVLVFHHESVSFAADKAELLSKNLATIASRYPEYLPTVETFEREDGIRSIRWALDGARLAAAHGSAARFTLIVTNWLEGGTAEAIRDIGAACGRARGPQLLLRCRSDGFAELTCDEPLLRATFSPAEWRPLFRLLTAAKPALVAIHQVLGYDAEFIRTLANWIGDYHSVFYIHDYFAFCPRVTMIDSTGAFCGKVPPDVCDRCVALGGRHEASRLTMARTEEHYELMKPLLWRVTHVVAPSANAARYLNKTYPKLKVEVVGHPEIDRQFTTAVREGSDDEVLLLGAIGPHKGSQKLLDIARLARLRHPQLKFRVVGYTDIDKTLLDVGNVEITGTYTAAELPLLVAQCRGRLALFLHLWPETYSYTLSEAVSYGFIPLVPDIGAPADRVRETGFGTIFPFPIQVEKVLSLIADIASGKIEPYAAGASPAAYRHSPDEVTRLRAVMGVGDSLEEVRVA